MVAAETAALADSFDGASRRELTLLQMFHHEKFKGVTEYEGTEKPKTFLRANYAADIEYTGPLIRTWCMSFEAMLQILKQIAQNSNYKNVEERMARIWSIRAGLMLLDGKLSALYELKLTYATTPTTFDRNGMRLEPPGGVVSEPFHLSVRAPPAL